MSEFLSRNRSWLMTPLCLVAALWVLAWWRAEGTPQPLAEGADGKLQCLSYTAFRKPDETPMNPDASVDEARVREDLSILSARTGCVRTYSVIQGLEHVPKVAKELGMQVLMGIWIGRERDKNDLEIERAIALARQYPDTIRGIVVGNEVLLRREQSAQQMATYLDRVRAAVDIPVTYADVWEFWAENKSLADHVSFVTVHILPYWEDHPVGIHDAIQHITGTAEQMRQMFHGKDVLIGETGWPSAGRQRMAAVASRVNEARFMREFSQAAADHHLNYNFIEGFDQPWKRGQEGAMGGNWGVFDSDGQPKFPATGPVAEDPHWYRGWLGAAAGALVALWLLRVWRVRGRATQVQLVALGVASGGLLVAQARYGTIWNRDVLEWGTSVIFGLASVALVVVMARLIALGRSDRPAGGGLESLDGVQVPSFITLWRRRRAHFDALDWLGVCRSFFLFGGALMALLLVFDSRYRGFPTVLYMLPLLGLLMARLAGLRLVGDAEERVLARICALGAVLFVLMEGFANTQSWVFGLTLLALVAAAGGLRLCRRGICRR